MEGKWVTAAELDGVKREDFVQNTPSPEPAPEAPAEQAQVEQASAEAPPAEVKPEAPVAPVVPNEPIDVPAPQVQPKKDWREVLKEEGFDDWSLSLLEHKKATGSAKEFLRAMSVDYNTMSAEDLLKQKIQLDFPGISSKALELKMKEELKKFPLDDTLYNEDEIAAGKELFDYEMNRVRQQFIAEQNKYLEPPKQDAAQQPDPQEQYEAYRKEFIANPTTQSFLQSKKIVLGEEDKFNFEISNPAELVNMVVDASEWQKMVSNPDGSPKIDLLLEAAAYIKYRTQIHKQLINYGKTLGEKKIVEQELHNIPEQGVPVPGAVQKDLWQTIRDSWK